MKKTAILFLILFLLIGGYFFLQYKSAHYTGRGTFVGDISQSLNGGNYKQAFATTFLNKDQLDTSKEIKLQQVNNLGYTFYLGEVELTGSTSINDDLKNQITEIIHNAKFPKALLQKTPIVVLNSLALVPGQYIMDPSARRGGDMPTLDPAFLYEGGIYGIYNNGMTVIYINKTILGKGLLKDVLTHELGHALGATFTSAEWESFFEIRGIPKEKALLGASWNLLPTEDFAEVYKNTFTGLDIRTSYGVVNQQTKDFINQVVSKE